MILYVVYYFVLYILSMSTISKGAMTFILGTRDIFTRHLSVEDDLGIFYYDT